MKIYIILHPSIIYRTAADRNGVCHTYMCFPTCMWPWTFTRTL